MQTKRILVFLTVVIAGALYFLKTAPNTPSTPKQEGPETKLTDGNSKDAASQPQDAGGPPKNATLGDSQAAWEKVVDDVIDRISSPSDQPAACRELIKIVKTVPPSAQGTLAKHIVNLADEAAFVEAFSLTDDKTLSPKFHKTIAAELLNQRDEVKLPGLLKIASSDWHPLRGQFLPILATLTGEDAGEDWGKWETIVRDKLKQSSQTPTTDSQNAGGGTKIAN